MQKINKNNFEKRISYLNIYSKFLNKNFFKIKLINNTSFFKNNIKLKTLILSFYFKNYLFLFNDTLYFYLLYINRIKKLVNYKKKKLDNDLIIFNFSKKRWRVGHVYYGLHAIHKTFNFFFDDWSVGFVLKYLGIVTKVYRQNDKGSKLLIKYFIRILKKRFFNKKRNLILKLKGLSGQFFFSKDIFKKFFSNVLIKKIMILPKINYYSAKIKSIKSIKKRLKKKVFKEIGSF